MSLHAATIFGSSFLLFLVQPVIAKQILPWFGGSAAVWTTCLVFFQSALLAGYAYSDLVVRRLTLRTQFRLHTVLLLLSLVALPVIPGLHWRPDGTESPSWLILGMLTTTVGLPYLMLSTTSPIVQSWFARARPGASPYRLFALSNAASLLALIGYPFLLEPWAPTRTQALGWSAGYGVFVALCIAAGWSTLKAPSTPKVPEPDVGPPPKRRKRRAKRKEADVARPAAIDEKLPPNVARQALWGTLAATSSLLLLAVSNHITQNLASVPLLWIMPLAIYLVTFVLCFSGAGWRHRKVFLAVLAVGLGVMAWTLADPSLTYRLAIQIGVFCCGLFLACMFCHGELVRLKPVPQYLTRFYLMIALGGAVGSALVGFIAPLVLPAYFELAGGLVLTALLLVWQVRRDRPAFGILGILAVVLTIGCAIWSIRQFYTDTVIAARNFYGVLRVRDVARGNDRIRSLIYGTIRHGTQGLSPTISRYPTTYFVPTSGIGRLLALPRPAGAPIRVGIIGLGVGTLAAYGRKGDVFRFYDINPEVLTIAQRDFTYLKNSDATIELMLGDARLALEREPKQNFDVLVIDAFFGDAIPVHLITAEALAIYKRHMNPGGVIAFHVTNRYLDLVPVVTGLADKERLLAMLIEDDTDRGPASASVWMLLSERRESLDRPELASVASSIQRRPDWPIWSDDFNNLVQVLK